MMGEKEELYLVFSDYIINEELNENKFSAKRLYVKDVGSNGSYDIVEINKILSKYNKSYCL